MALNILPTELLDNIIIHVFPEGFESMAMTCKKFYALCKPFIEQHKSFRLRFHHFSYCVDMRDSLPIIGTAFDLIQRIADKPYIANYIRSADFKIDGLSKYALYRESMKDDHGSDAVIRLFANSPYLEQAGLDWQEYYAEIVEDVQATRYSQHAAAFLLTLLPNVESIYLPKIWKPNDATDKLVDAVVWKAHQSRLPYHKPSLARVSRFGFSVSLGPGERCELNWASLFLALPRVRFFRGPSCVAVDDGDHTTMEFRSPCSGFATTLETVHFVSCWIDEVGIAKFLKHASHLKTLRYSHGRKENVDSPNWNIYEFVTAIEREAGSHLEGLSVIISELRGSIAPGRVSMSGFQRLQKLELPLEAATCNITEVVPDSVSQLSFIASGTDDHAKTLNVMFQDFALRKKSTLPVLETIFLTCFNTAGNAYKEQCTRLLGETEKAGVALKLMSSWTYVDNITWDAEE